MKILALAFVMFCQVSYAVAKGIDFLNMGLDDVMVEAQVQQKPVIVAFTSAWSQDCSQMDKKVYSNKNVGEVANAYYLAVKIDIDDFDGYKAKNQYEVSYLPTTLIVSPKGVVLKRIETVISANDFKSLLSAYRGAKVPKAIGAPAASPAPRAVEAAQSKGLYRFQVAKVAYTGFSVQVGAFGKYESVLEEVENLERKFKMPVLVSITDGPTGPLFKVLVGKFSTKAEADKTRASLKKQGYNGLIRDLSNL